MSGDRRSRSACCSCAPATRPARSWPSRCCASTAATHFEVHSAPARNRAGINPLTVRVLEEAGLDAVACARSRSTEFLGQEFDYVITVCDQARQACPVFPGVARIAPLGLRGPGRGDRHGRRAAGGLPARLHPAQRADRDHFLPLARRQRGGCRRAAADARLRDGYRSSRDRRRGAVSAAPRARRGSRGPGTARTRSGPCRPRRGRNSPIGSLASWPGSASARTRSSARPSCVQRRPRRSSGSASASRLELPSGTLGDRGCITRECLKHIR